MIVVIHLNYWWDCYNAGLILTSFRSAFWESLLKLIAKGSFDVALLYLENTYDIWKLCCSIIYVLFIDHIQCLKAVPVVMLQQFHDFMYLSFPKKKGLITEAVTTSMCGVMIHVPISFSTSLMFFYMIFLFQRDT